MFGPNSPPWPVHLRWLCPAWLIASMSYTRLWSMWSFWLAFCDCGFRSVDCGIVVLGASICPRMDQDKRLVQTSWWEGLAIRKTGSWGPWCWERLKAGGEGDDRGWDGWMASPTRWTWVWASSGSWWWTGKPGVLRFMGSQRVRHDWLTDLIWPEPDGLSTWHKHGPLEKGMANHFSILALRTPWTVWKGKKICTECLDSILFNIVK